MRAFPFSSFARRFTRTAGLLCFTLAVQSPTPARAQAGSALVVEPCTADAPLGLHASLKVGPLTRKEGVYSGEYNIKMKPLPVGSENGSLSVAISDELIGKLAKGVKISFKGAATNSAGRTRTIEGDAVPTDGKQGSLRLRITSEHGKLTFETPYRFKSR